MNEQAEILIVDDQEENLKVVSGFLNTMGYNLALATDGKSALNILSDYKIDLVLLDVIMPGMDGFEVCSRIKENPLTKEIPVIFLTAKAEPEDIAQGFKLGGADYLTKPFKQEELLARVKNHLQIRFLMKIMEEQLKHATMSRDFFFKTLYDFGHVVQSDHEGGK